MAAHQYVAARGLTVSTYLALKLKRPLFLEGEPGVGKTEVAKVLAAALDTELIRLQCYEGLDVSHAVYEWNYPRQILEIRLLEGTHALDREAAERELFTEAFLIKRPLLRAIEQSRQRPPVLLIDEIDRADEEFEGYLLELLSEFQITIPELGTIRAAEPPIVVITSNRTREVHDALKRRCVYSWIDYPDERTERRIIAAKVPGVSDTLAEQVTAFVQELRTTELYKKAGVSETLDWAAALVTLNRERLDIETVEETLGLLLKNQEDIQSVRGERAAGRSQPGAGTRRGRAVSDTAIAGNVLLFGRVLRAAGLPVHHGRLVDAIQALALVGIRSRTDVRATLRSLLVHRHEDIARFDQAFDLFFRAHRPPAPGLPLFSIGERARVVARPAPGVALPIELEDLGTGRHTPDARAIGAWSRDGVSRTKDFADFTDSELERARELLQTLPWRLSLRRTRRWQGASRGAIDLRPLLRRNLMRGGDLRDLPRRQRRETARPIVLIADVSGSMERYSRVVLHFVYGLAQSGTRVDAFVFATRLTRVTRQIAGRRGQLLARLARDVGDWGGGTRIGEALRAFNTSWARRVMRHGPIVIVVSDGWDRGDPELLSREIARVRRSCRRLIWLNPLLGSARYEPLTRGIQAALRHVDDFLPAHNLASIEQLANHLRALPAKSRPVGWRRTDLWN